MLNDLNLCVSCVFFFFSSRRRHTRCALVTGVQTCALPISERSARRPEESNRPVRGIAARQRLRTAPVTARIDLTPPGDEEFVLLVARRDGAGLAIIDSVPHNSALLERAVLSIACPAPSEDA